MGQSLLKLTWRHELKFLIRRAFKANVLDMLNNFAKLDDNAADGYYDINSIYWDTLNSLCYENKLSGNAIRWKLRVRWYGQEKSKLGVREIKWRKGTLNAKDRVWGNIDELTDEIYQGDFSKHITGDRLAVYGSLFPKVIIKYRRHPYSFADGLARITLDTAIKSEPFSNLYHYEKELLRDYVILEVKSLSAIPKAIVSMVNNLPTQRISYSKYVEGVAAFRKHDGADISTDGVFSL